MSGTKKASTLPLAIVSQQAGSTRDRKDRVAVVGGLTLRLMDTGGLEDDKTTDASELLKLMRSQVMKCIEEAVCVLFVVDAKEGITALDELLAKTIRETIIQSKNAHSGTRRKSVVLVANKGDGCFVGEYLADCYTLELGDPVVVSSKQLQGLDDLYDRLVLEVGDWKSGEYCTYEPSDAATSRRVDEAYEEDDAESMHQQENESFFEGLRRVRGAPGKCISKSSLRHAARENWVSGHGVDEASNFTPDDIEEFLPRQAYRRGQYHVDEGSMVFSGKRRKIRPSQYKDPEARRHAMVAKREEVESGPIRLVVIGLPNTGKSTLVNALLREERQVVDNKPGTTTDAISMSWSWKDHPIELVDTAGVGRGWRYKGTDLLLDAGKQTLRNIRQSHVCILCIDATEVGDGKDVGHHELALAGLVSEQEGKCLAIAVTKWDLLPEKKREQVRDEVLDKVNKKMPHAKGCPVVFISSVQGMNLSTLMTRIMVLYSRWNKRVETSRLNSWIRQFMQHWTPPWRFGQKCDILFMCQTRARPPTLVVWSSTVQRIPANYLRQITNKYREEFDMYGTPIRILNRTTCMPKPGQKLSSTEILKWKRLGPKQAAAVAKLSRRGGPILPNMKTRSKPKQSTPINTRNFEEKEERQRAGSSRRRAST
eukprot:GHVQ01033907.1.p1 GENE.GHVQ01033907.1~~GHVQ01033907.1.p1  ORF type:complete len:653 (-),score=70.87 GHVQ01033907.1:140-2098(-)